jgi:two-component system, NtrC family, sensor kinase
LLGAINIVRYEVQPFTGKQIALMETFADQAVIAIENTRLFDEVQARTHDLSVSLEQQIATAEVLRVISTSPTDERPVYETIVRNAVSLCGGLFANVFRFDGELLHFDGWTTGSGWTYRPRRATGSSRSHRCPGTRRISSCWR